MAEYETEEEQIEAFKKWWKENGRSIITGLILGVAIIGGWKGWGIYQADRTQLASDTYEQINKSIKENNAEAIQKGVSLLQDDFDNTPYAVLGTLAQAKQFVLQKDLPAAEKALQWAVDNAEFENTVFIATIRLARVQSAQNKLDEALETLQSETFPESFSHLADEVLGDIYLIKGNEQKAREAYTRASIKNNNQTLRIKLDDLGSNEEEKG